MNSETDTIISTLIENDEDEEFDASLAKEVEPPVMEEWLHNAGFKQYALRLHTWHKIMANEAVVVSRLPGGEYYSATFYQRGTEPGRWVPGHRYEGGVPGVIAELNKIAEIPVQESIDDEELGFEMKDVIGVESKQEIYKLLDSGLLEINGSIDRFSTHYVHEKTTSCSLESQWSFNHDLTDDEITFQNRIEGYITELEKEIDEEIVQWNRKIYKELEAMYDDSISEPVVTDNIRANDYDFDEDGDREDDGGFKYDQLNDKAKEKARNWWIEAENEIGDTFWAEGVIAEWKWLLDNKGFSEVEISYSGFWSQGDGASFTAKSIDIKKYLTGPDPLQFPGQDREQLDESDEGEPEIDPKDVYDVNRRQITNIQTNADYAEYEARVADFFAYEGINNLTSMVDEEGRSFEDAFSRTPCRVCRRQLSGERILASGYAPATKEVKTYWICKDCEYYAAYGMLDDMTMMELRDVAHYEPPNAEGIQERYGGARQERGIWYHGTSSALVPKILSQGLIPEPKRRAWGEDPDTSIVQHTRKSLPGIYVTTSLSTATGAALRVAQRDKSNEAIIVMELQPRSMVADEDTISSGLSSIASHLSGSAYHHIWPYFMEFYGNRLKEAENYRHWGIFNEQKVQWVARVTKQLFYRLGKNAKINPELEKRVKELLFNEGFRVMLERNVAYTTGWDLDHYKSQWTENFGEYGTDPPLPKPNEAENHWLAFTDKLARTLKGLARPLKSDWNLNTTGRVLSPVGFKGSNRIVCVVERFDDRKGPEYHSRMLVHYGKPPQKLIDDWTQNIGKLDKPGDIVYKSPVTEAGTDDEDFETKEVLGEPPPEPVFIVISSHGTLKALVDDGRVIDADILPEEHPDFEAALNEPGGESLKQIARFDVGEWRRFYRKETIDPNFSIDILDLGYWLKDGTYEPPVEDWRKEFAKGRHEQNIAP